MCVCGGGACMCICVWVCAGVYGGQRRVSYSETGVSGVCELPDVAAGNWTLVLCKNDSGLSLLSDLSSSLYYVF